MVAANLLALLDDIATVLDDVAVLTKVAAKKTAGVLGDDLALNAQQVTGVSADREIPVVWAVAKGSFLNKAILVPVALLISVVAPWLITPLLMVGGAYLCFEGFEKLAHRFLHSPEEDEAHHADLTRALTGAPIDLVAFERDKIRGAIRTDFILSGEIIAITLGAVAQAAFMTKVAVLASVAVVMTVGVYGFVAGIVKLDDLGLWLVRTGRPLATRVGRGLLVMAPMLMRVLSVVGTAAMFLVGGGILVHGLPAVHHLIEAWTAHAAVGGAVVQALLPTLLDGLVGVIAGGVVLAVWTLGLRVWRAWFRSASAGASRTTP